MKNIEHARQKLLWFRDQMFRFMEDPGQQLPWPDPTLEELVCGLAEAACALGFADSPLGIEHGLSGCGGPALCGYEPRTGNEEFIGCTRWEFPITSGARYEVTQLLRRWGKAVEVIPILTDTAGRTAKKQKQENNAPLDKLTDNRSGQPKASIDDASLDECPPADTIEIDHGIPQVRLSEGKRASGHYDVFLCHNSKDKPAVKEIGQRLLIQRGLVPWLDERDLRPGDEWQDKLEKLIDTVGSVAVFLGPRGLGPWQDKEQKAFLRRYTNKSDCRVIPVVLPGVDGDPEWPTFLNAFQQVDFRESDPDPFEQLVYGITGERGPLGRGNA